METRAVGRDAGPAVGRDKDADVRTLAEVLEEFWAEYRRQFPEFWAIQLPVFSGTQTVERTAGRLDSDDAERIMARLARA